MRPHHASAPLRMLSQEHSCLVDALYHLLVKALDMSICISTMRAIMQSEGDTPIELAEAFASAYNCTLTPCTESFTHGKKGGPELHLLKQTEGLFLVLLNVHMKDGSTDRHAVAYDGMHVLDNGRCLSLHLPRLPHLASRTSPPAPRPPAPRLPRPVPPAPACHALHPAPCPPQLACRTRLPHLASRAAPRPHLASRVPRSLLS